MCVLVHVFIQVPQLKVFGQASMNFEWYYTSYAKVKKLLTFCKILHLCLHFVAPRNNDKFVLIFIFPNSLKTSRLFIVTCKLGLNATSHFHKQNIRLLILKKIKLN